MMARFIKRRVPRRRFLQAAACAASSGAVGALGASEGGAQGDWLREPARDTPIRERADVVVCGGGPAGVTAAIAAARAGADTRLVEVNGCLGGVWTAGLLSLILDYDNKPGLMQEYRRRLAGLGAKLEYDRGHLAYDVEPMKLLLETMCAEAGVRVRLHTRVAAAVTDARGRLTAAVTESKSGREALAAKVFVDASGDGDLAVQAGCAFDYGHPQTGQGQPMSLIALVTGIEAEAVAPFTRGLAEPRGEPNPKKRFLEELRRAGVEPSYAAPSLFYLPGPLFCLMLNHEYGVRGFDADEVTAATLAARAEVNRCVAALRRLGGPWRELRLAATAEHIGVRESRRIRGRYQVTQEDLVRGARHSDAVCRVTFGVDVHSPHPEKSKAFDHGPLRARPKDYDIPYRALLPRDVEGLLLAGRCLSGDFIAHSSYRVTGNAVATGQAAGAAAALAAHSGAAPHELAWPDIQQVLARITEMPG